MIYFGRKTIANVSFAKKKNSISKELQFLSSESVQEVYTYPNRLKLRNECLH